MKYSNNIISIFILLIFYNCNNNSYENKNNDNINNNSQKLRTKNKNINNRNSSNFEIIQKNYNKNKDNLITFLLDDEEIENFKGPGTRFTLNLKYTNSILKLLSINDLKELKKLLFLIPRLLEVNGRPEFDRSVIFYEIMLLGHSYEDLPSNKKYFEYTNNILKKISHIIEPAKEKYFLNTKNKDEILPILFYKEFANFDYYKKDKKILNNYNLFLSKELNSKITLNIMETFIESFMNFSLDLKKVFFSLRPYFQLPHLDRVKELKINGVTFTNIPKPNPNLFTPLMLFICGNEKRDIKAISLSTKLFNVFLKRNFRPLYTSDSGTISIQEFEEKSEFSHQVFKKFIPLLKLYLKEKNLQMPNSLKNTIKNL